MPRALTATEEMIIEGLRTGMLDAEIAVRLGVSIGDVKHRITTILRDFRLLGREALLDWTPPEPSDPEADVPLAPAAADRRMTMLAAGFAALSVAVAAIALVAVQPWEETGGARVAPRATPSTVAIPAALQAAQRTTVSGVHQGYPVSLDATYALLLKAWNESGTLSGIDRVYRHPVSRQTIHEPVWRPPEGGRFTGVVTGQWRTIAITYDDAGGSWLVESKDGGTTWGAPVAIEQWRGPVMTGTFGTVLAPPTIGTGEFQLVSGGAVGELAAPPGAASVAPVGSGPGDVPLWSAGDGTLVDGKGNTVITLFTSGRPVSGVLSLTWLPEKRYGLVIWHSGDDRFTSTVRGDGTTRTTLPGSPGAMTGGAGVVRFVGTYCHFTIDEDSHPWYPCLPVLYHPGQGTFHPINDTAAVIPESEPSAIVGTIPGPFVRVRDEVECAPLHLRLGEPSTACAAPGALAPITHFRSFGNGGPEEPHHALHEGDFYVRVAGEGGQSLWVATDYLEIGFAPPIIPYPEMWQ